MPPVMPVLAREFEHRGRIEETLASIRRLMAKTLSERPVSQGIDLISFSQNGKLLRSQVLLYSINCLGVPIPMEAVTMAAIIEMAHLATLCHDGVLDSSLIRRSSPLLAQSDLKSFILTGDYVLFRSLDLLSRHGDLKLLSIFSDALSAVFRRKLLRREQHNIGTLTRRVYFEITQAKTGALFAAAGKIAGILAQATDQETRVLEEFGRAFGIIDQIAADYHDCANRAVKLGKCPGTSFRNGRPTLPLIYALQNSSDVDRLFLINAFGKAELNDTDFHVALQILRATGALQKVQNDIFCFQIAAKNVLYRSFQDSSFLNCGLLELLESICVLD
jgi:octaprenyl-diphosphate synthase